MWKRKKNSIESSPGPKNSFAKNLINKLAQQKLPGTIFLPNAKCFLMFTGIFFLFFFFCGLTLVTSSFRIHDFPVQYDNQCFLNTTSKLCIVDFEVTSDLKSPVFLYYSINGFYQNHRQYVKSVQYSQLRGKNKSEGSLGSCSPALYMSDIWKVYPNITSVGGHVFNGSEIANPCGMSALTVFNDTFRLRPTNMGAEFEIPINGTGISWSTDKYHKFRRNGANDTIQWLDVENERFINWMIFSTLPNWKKLWGRIDQDILKGNYTMFVINNYNVSGFGATKFFQLSTVSNFGGTTKIIGFVMMTFSMFYLLAGITFAMVAVANRKKNPKQTIYIDFKWQHTKQ